MANRAYLHSSHRPDAWKRPDEEYYDSRWTIPLAWFFFYGPEDIRLVDVHYNDSHWQEVKLSTAKRAALTRFAAREPLLMSLVQDRISHAAVDEFLAKVEKRPGRFLLLDPDEVLTGMPEEDPVHAERLTRLLTLLQSGEPTPEAVREAARPYLDNFDPDPERCLGQVIGYTYW